MIYPQIPINFQHFKNINHFDKFKNKSPNIRENKLEEQLKNI
jgi:hypothetical protein